MFRPSRIFWRRFLIGVVACGAIAVVGFRLATRPHYAWFNFGPEARLQLLIADHGWWTTITKYVDGQPAGEVQRLGEWDEWQPLTLGGGGDAQATYEVQRVTPYTREGRKGLMANVRVDGAWRADQYCDVGLMATDLAQADAAHFDGPLSIAPVMFDWRLPEDFAFVRGGEPLRVAAYAGTFDQARGTWTVVRSHEPDGTATHPSDVRPVVEVSFPPADGASEPIVERYTLDEVCCGPLYYRLISPPAGIGTGQARLTYTFPTWREAAITSTTIDIPVIDMPVADASDF